MIKRVRANQPTFRDVSFSPGFNVVVADRSKESTKKDSRNGLGKSTLIKIIHFCLGADAKDLKAPQLQDWAFTLDLRLGGVDVSVTRSVAKPQIVQLVGDTSGWPIEPEAVEGKPTLRVSDWIQTLGSAMFGLAPTTREPFTPSFRSLISYFVRRSRDAFSTPFEHYRKQLGWDMQLHIAYLLDLSWEDARAFKLLSEREGLLKNLRTASEQGLVGDVLGSIGELDADKVQLEQQLQAYATDLGAFRVLPQYRDIEARANRLTELIHGLSNENIADRRLLKRYEDSIASEDPPQADEVLQLYQAANVQLPGAVQRRLEEVQTFHATVVANRRAFLHEEIGSLREAISRREAELAARAEERGTLLDTLRTHRALDEFQSLQRHALEIESQLKQVTARIADLKKVEAGKGALKIEREQTRRRARRDYDERHAQRERAIALFNDNSQALYNAPGKLVIDVGNNGFTFKVEIERSGSQGIESMKVLCFDLMLAELWSARGRSPGFLVHDSAIFDGVDERQVALGLQRAHVKSDAAGFQYICTMNSDAIPAREFSGGFSLDPFVRLRLTDATPEGCLLGIRY